MARADTGALRGVARERLWLIGVGACLCGCLSRPIVNEAQATSSPAVCAFDRTQMLALSQDAFDQDMNGGWRALAAREGCIEAAADLIRDYREAKGLPDSVFVWHEGQLRASLEETERAIELFEKSRYPQEDPLGWNLYVEASVAFLRKDKPALIRARDALAQVQKPADWDPRDAQGHAFAVSWPLNLDVVDRLIRCFDRPYKEAYGNCPAP